MSAQRPVTRWIVIAVSAAATAILLGLSAWQYSKIGPRDAEIALVKVRMEKPAKALPKDISGSEEAWFYRPVRVSGTYHPAYARHVYRAGPDGAPGYHLLAPLQRPDGKGIWVDLGWFSRAQKPAFEPSGLISSDILPPNQAIVLGKIHPRQRDAKLVATPEPDQSGNIYYRVQPEILSRGTDLAFIQSVYLIAETAPKDLIPSRAPVKLEHNHRSYAFQWLAMAAGLVGVTIVFLRREGPR